MGRDGIELAICRGNHLEQDARYKLNYLVADTQHLAILWCKRVKELKTYAKKYE